MIALGLRMLARDWRAGELRLLTAALAIAVASVTSVGFFADRVSQALVRDAHQLLGADLVLASDHPWASAVNDEIARRGLEHAAAVSFISMAQAGADEATRSQLAGVKAVSAGYPLRGTLRIAPAQGAPDAPAAHAPQPGEVWLDERLASALAAPVGSRVRLGEREFTVAALLTLEPERGIGFFNLAPRLMMNLADVPSTGLVQTGSRVTYTLYAAGPPAALRPFERWARARLGRGERLEDLQSGRPEVRASIERAQRFLGLSALLAAILAGVSIALGTRRFVERHLDACAVMRCLGATQARLLRLYAIEFVVLGLAASAAGCLAGYAAQEALAGTLGGLIGAELPAASALPALQGLLVGLVLLLGFALPPLVRLKDVPAMRVMRREAEDPRSALAAYAAGAIVLVGLLLWQAGDLLLGAYLVGGFALAAVLFALLAWAALRILASARVARFSGARSPALRYGLANLRRHARGNAVQVASLALGLTALLLLAFTRNDLVDAWRRTAPPDAPNHFVLGIQPDQVAGVKAFLAVHDIGEPEILPMVRGRLVAENGRPVDGKNFSDERARRLVERDFNLSYAAEPPGYNTIIAGRWTGGQGAGLSVEQGIAARLGWKIGDELTFSVGGETFTAAVTSVRKVRWDSMKVNFFVIGPPSLLAGFPTSFITAFRVAAAQDGAMNALTQRFPNLTVVDVGAVVRQAQGVIDQLIGAVQFVFLFALGAGLLVLYAALVATEDERRREAAVMRVCGASRAQVAGSQRVEFLTMGVVAGVLATVAAVAIGRMLALQVFDLELPLNAWEIVAGPVAGVALLSLNAWLSARKVLKTPPALTLREAG